MTKVKVFNNPEERDFLVCLDLVEVEDGVRLIVRDTDTGQPKYDLLDITEKGIFRHRGLKKSFLGIETEGSGYGRVVINEGD